MTHSFPGLKITTKGGQPMLLPSGMYSAAVPTGSSIAPRIGILIESKKFNMIFAVEKVTASFASGSGYTHNILMRLASADEIAAEERLDNEAVARAASEQYANPSA